MQKENFTVSECFLARPLPLVILGLLKTWAGVNMQHVHPTCVVLQVATYPEPFLHNCVR